VSSSGKFGLENLPEMFGPHLTLDLSECDRRKLSDLSHIYDLLDELPDIIGMHKITPPYTFIYRPGDNPSEWGVSGFVIIAESHISIHTFPDRGSAFVDVFSCKQFDIHKAVDYIVAKLDAHKADKKLSGRGKEYPRQVEAAREIVIRSRPSLKH
jgi:S-adenosylmethionine decarboxylase